MDIDTIEEVKENLVLNSITDRSANKPEVDSLVEGPVILVEKSSVYVDLALSAPASFMAGNLLMLKMLSRK